MFRVDIFGLLAWGALLVFAAATAAASTLMLTTVIRAAMASAYLAGLYVESGEFGSAYLRTILTSFVFSTVVLTVLGPNARWPAQSLIAPRTQIAIQRIGLLGIGAWSICVAGYLYYYQQTDFRLLIGGNYLTVSDLLVLFCLSIQLRRDLRWPERTISALVCLLALVLYGSRPSILLVVAILAILFARRLGPRMSLLLIVPALTGLAATVYAFGNEWLLLSRLATVLDPANDQSLLVRVELFGDFFKGLAANPRCLIVACPPEVGRYAHNILSVIQYFGIFGIAFCATYLAAITVGLRRILRSEAWPLYVYSFAMVGLFRAWTHIIFAVCLALLILLVESALRPTPQVERVSPE